MDWPDYRRRFLHVILLHADNFPNIFYNRGKCPLKMPLFRMLNFVSLILTIQVMEKEAFIFLAFLPVKETQAIAIRAKNSQYFITFVFNIMRALNKYCFVQVRLKQH